MSTDANKKLVAEFWEAFSSSHFDKALSMLADDATWWVAGSFELSGTYTKAQFAELVKGVSTALPQGIKVMPKTLTADEDRVAVEAESYAPHTNGKIYNNFYHFLMRVRNGKIASVREYLDTMHAKDILCS